MDKLFSMLEKYANLEQHLFSRLVNTKNPIPKDELERTADWFANMVGDRSMLEGGRYTFGDFLHLVDGLIVHRFESPKLTSVMIKTLDSLEPNDKLHLVVEMMASKLVPELNDKVGEVFLQVKDLASLEDDDRDLPSYLAYCYDYFNPDRKKRVKERVLAEAPDLALFVN